MNAVWIALHIAASSLASSEAEARRLANLVMAASLAGHLSGKGPPRDGAALRDAAASLALAPCRWAGSHRSWTRLLDATRSLGPAAVNAEGLDGWVHAFQGVDARRKSLGAFATPHIFADALADVTLKGLAFRSGPIRLIDPACGAGNLLLAAQRWLVRSGRCSPADAALALHGIEVDPEARELAVLLLWLSAGPGTVKPEEIARNVLVDDALIRDWWSSGAPYDVVLMNPPWESLRTIGTASASCDARDRTVARLSTSLPGAPDLPPLYSAQGRGDRNLFKAFVELAPHLLRKGGRLGAIIPAAFGSDDGMTELRRRYLLHFELDRWTAFENRRQHFAIDGRFKFGLLFGTRSPAGTRNLLVRGFATEPVDLSTPHVLLSKTDLDRISGDDCVIPELCSEVERDTLVHMLGHGTPFFRGGALGVVRYRRETDLTLGRARGEFRPVEDLRKLTGDADGHWRTSDGRVFVPVLEGRMVGQYDCFQKSWVSGAGRRAVWRENEDRGLRWCRPQFVAAPQSPQAARIALCDVTSATNTRTVLATAVPSQWLCGNTAPVLLFGHDDLAFAGLAVLNSMVFDWLARRVVSGLHINKFYLARLVWPRIGPEALQRLTRAGRRLASAAPRGGVNGKRRILAADKASSIRAGIEAEVACGYGLDRKALSFILTTDNSDRRGMWRHYEADPLALQVAQAALDILQANAGEPNCISQMQPAPSDLMCDTHAGRVALEHLVAGPKQAA